MDSPAPRGTPGDRGTGAGAGRRGRSRPGHDRGSPWGGHRPRPHRSGRRPGDLRAAARRRARGHRAAPRRLGGGGRGTAAVPLPGGSPLLSLQQPAPAARQPGLDVARHGLSPVPVRLRDPPLLPGGAVPLRRPDRSTGGHRRPARGPDAQTGRAPAQRAPARTCGHHRSRARGRGPRQSRQVLSPRRPGEGSDPPGRAAAPGGAPEARRRRPHDPHHGHPDRPRRPGRDLYGRVRSLREPARQRARPAPRLHRGARLRDLLPGRGADRGRGPGRPDGERCRAVRDRRVGGPQGRRARLHPEGPAAQRVPPRIRPRRRAGAEEAGRGAHRR